MEKIFARYYYVPICTESFASLDRLRNFFSHIDDKVQFDVINYFTDEIELNDSFNDCEMRFIKSVQTNQALLMYGKLFINDIEVLGFPPSRNQIEEILTNLNLKANYEELKAFYNAPINNKTDFDKQLFCTTKFDEDNCFDACLICTKFSRYLNKENYSKINWEKYELQKSNHLIRSYRSNDVIGFIEYHNNIPVGFIEGYSTKNASKYGFIVTDDSNGCMITCLHIREEAKGYGISKKLISEFLNEAKEKGFKTVEVIAFQDNMNWQPIGLYTKMNFVEQKKIGDISLMSIVL